MSKRKQRDEPQSGITYLIFGLIGLGLIYLFNRTLLSTVHGMFLAPIYPYKNYLYWLTTPLFIKFLYLGIIFLIPHDSSK